MQCQLCQHIARTLHPSSGYRVPKYYGTIGRRYINVSSWQGLQENQSCPTCSLIVALFYNEFAKHGPNPRSGEYDFCLIDDLNSGLSLNLLSNPYTSEDPFFRINPLSEETSERLGIIMDQNWVDLERVQEWIRSCDTTHGKCQCEIFRAGGSFPSRDMYFISVSNNCLVKANNGDRYVALSYIWGAGSRQFKALKANLEFLRRKDSLSNTNVRDHVPNTVQRAMRFTSLLGLDLLWVDLFCIVQDDPVHSAAQINDMASIYSSSYLTLCAADGIDADSGLLGVPQSSQPRNMQQDILAFTDVETSKWVRWMYGDAVYDERGWTFQEKILSRRTLSFTDHGLEWRCQEVVSREQDLNIRRPASDYLDLSIARADTLWPCLKKWDNLVSSYLKRTLTYEEDILRAFSGILGALDGSMSEGFHFGLPQQFFDVALLWVPMEQLTPRKDPRNGVARSEFPSWSWAGWKGATESQIDVFGLGHLRSDLIVDHRPRLIDIFPCVAWFKIDMDTLDKARIPNDYAKYQVKGLEGTVTLPPGWSAYLDESNGPFYYRYDKAPSSHTFWYPIPTVRTIQPASRHRWGPILSFKTLRGYLEIGKPLSREEQGDNTYPLYSLNTEAGDWGGVIYVHYLLPETTTAQKASCELILISGGFATEDDDNWIPEWNFARRPRAGDHYLFYHVLWIEWQGDIAYRKGLARVVQTVWDDLPKDEVDIRLG